MGEWKRVKLGEICSLITKGATPRGEYQVANSKDAVAFVRAENVNGTTICRSELKCIDSSIHQRELKRSQLRDGDILITIAGAIGRTAIVDSSILPANINQAVAIIRLDTADFDRRFVLDYLRLPALREELTAISSGQSVQANLNLHQVGEIEIPCPPLPTQRRIAAVLGALDDKIEVNRKICENLEAQAQALFKAWFVDFEPFGGKRPEGWKMGKLGDVAEVTSGKRPPTRSDVADGESVFPLLGAAAIMGFTSQYMFDEPILVTGRVGTHGVIQRSFGRSWPSDNTLVIRAKRFEFVYQILKRIDYGKMNRGSTQPLITQSDLKGVEILIPDEALLNQFEEAVAPLMRLQYDKLQESRILAVMRDALLPKLMSGELAVEKVNL